MKMKKVLLVLAAAVFVTTGGFGNLIVPFSSKTAFAAKVMNARGQKARCRSGVGYPGGNRGYCPMGPGGVPIR